MDARCYNHPDTEATANCADCGEPICAACTCLLRGETYCAADYQIARVDPMDRVRPVATMLRPASPPVEVSARPLKVKMMPYHRVESAIINPRQQSTPTPRQPVSDAARQASRRRTRDWLISGGAITPGLALLTLWPFGVVGLMVVAGAGLAINIVSLFLSVQLNSSKDTSVSIFAAMLVNALMVMAGVIVKFTSHLACLNSPPPQTPCALRH